MWLDVALSRGGNKTGGMFGKVLRVYVVLEIQSNSEENACVNKLLLSLASFSTVVSAVLNVFFFSFIKIFPYFPQNLPHLLAFKTVTGL